MDPGCPVFDSSSSRRGGVLLLKTGEPMFRGWRPVVGDEEGTAKRSRLFFTSPEELLEEEYYYDEQLPEKKRRLTPEQVDLLEKSFEEENKLEPERKSELAKKIGVQPRQVAVWFQNRRARSKTKQLEQDFDHLKSSYDSLLADHHSLLEDNDRLRSQVACLNEKLHEVNRMGNSGEKPLSFEGDVTVANELLKADDCLSTRSGGGAVVLEQDCPQHLVDSSGDSYFPENLGCSLGGPGDADDDDCGDGCSYLPEEVGSAHLCWWIWN